MGRSYTQIAIADAQADLDRFAAELAASIASQQAATESERHTARITALVATAGITAAGITLTPKQATAPRKPRRTTVRINLEALGNELDALRAELAADIASKQAAELKEQQAAELAAMFTRAGIPAAGIKLSANWNPDRRLTRNELILAAARADLDSLAADIQAAIETGTPITPEPPAPPAPVQLTGWAGIRQAAKAGRAYQKAYTETYAAEMARSRR